MNRKSQGLLCVVLGLVLLLSGTSIAQVVATSDFTGITSSAGTDSITTAPNWGLAKDLYGGSFGTVDVVDEELTLTHTDTFPPLVYQADFRWYFGLAAGANAPGANDVFVVRFDQRIDTLSNNFQYRPAIFMHVIDDSWAPLTPVGETQPPIEQIDLPGQQTAMFRMNDGSAEPSPPDNPLPSDGWVGETGWGTDIDFDGLPDNTLVPGGETATVELVVNRSGSLFVYEGQDVTSGSFGIFTKVQSSGASIPGNYDGNSIVDDDDFLVWTTAFGDSVTPGTGADGNGDGTIDGADYTVWRDNYGATGGGLTTLYNGERVIDSTGVLTTLRLVTYAHGWVGSLDNFEVEILANGSGTGSGSAALGSVPEPSSLTLGIFALGLCFMQLRRERHHRGF